VSPLVGLAFGAGLLAPLNPCGIALLPAYLATFLDPASPGTGRAGAGGRMRRALSGGAAVTAGFIATTTLVGLGLAVGVRALLTVVPWLAAALGLLLVVVGVVMLAGGRMPLRLPDLKLRGPSGAGWWRLAAFGGGYALASASCTLAVLLAVVTQAVAAGTAATLVGVFAAYAAGSGLLLLALAVAGAAADTALTRGLGRLAHHLPRIGGGLLAASGAYLAVTWAPALCGGTPTSSLTGVTSPITGWISGHPRAVVLAAGVLLAASVVAALASRWATRRRTDTAGAAEDCGCPPAPDQQHTDRAAEPAPEPAPVRSDT
jgi:cytochrome c-type biogenesis protein